MQLPFGQLCAFLKDCDHIVRKSSWNSKCLARMWKYDAIRDNLLWQYRDAKIHYFGSRLIGLSSHYSDFDIYIEFDSLTRISHDDAVSLVLDMEQYFDSSELFVMRNSRCNNSVPVIRGYYLPKGIKCDIQFSNKLCVANANVAKHLFLIQPEAAKLFHATRIWLQMLRISFKRNQLMILVVFFLQNHNYLPAIERIQSDLPPVMVDGWNVQFDERRTLQDYGCRRMGYWKYHFTAFFSFYGNFNFRQFVIFPYHGSPQPKLNYPTSHHLIQMCQDSQMVGMRSLMITTNLVSFDTNVTRDIGRDRLNQFIEACKLSHNWLMNSMF